MGWDAILERTDLDDQKVTVGNWNFTHNTNQMIVEAMGIDPAKLKDYWHKPLGKCWWDLFHGKRARDVWRLLDRAVNNLEKYPDQFGRLDSPNGWGTREHLLPVLTDMLKASRKYPDAVWSFWG